MKIVELLKKSDPAYRKHLWIFLVAYFLVLFNYPLIRASSITLFFEAFGAKSSPAALFWSVAFLSVSIYTCNKLQAKFSVQKVFLWASIFSVATFLISGIFKVAYVAFIWKEIYIVIQVHLLLAYANNFFKKEDFKVLVGPVGAAGSLGGILGGLLTSAISQHSGTLNVLWVGLLFVFVPALFFLMTPSTRPANETTPKTSPLASLNDPLVRKYVFYIASVVALTQFMINILDFKFNLAFEAAISDSSARTSYLGGIYTWTNFATFLMQVFLLPYILPRVSDRNYHLFIPTSFLVCVTILMSGFGAGLMSVAVIYIYVKAADYSLFSSGKEILYQPLHPEQKYGAKYLTDMLVYRTSKALVAAVLIYLQSSTILNVLMIVLLLFWMIMIIKLFTIHRKLN